MYAILLHDRGIEPTHDFLERLRAPRALVVRVVALVERRRAPAELVHSAAAPSAYRRLVRELAGSDVSPELLERVARAEAEAHAKSFPEGRQFLAEIARLAIPEGGRPDAVFGRHLLAHGLAPGPEFTRILARCREVQDETGWSDPEQILRRALDNPA
jgi:tRNA nucleotidyltransferase (CCA-adding enzyme)